MNTKIFMLLMMLLITPVMAAVPPLQNIYSVQVGAYLEESAAKARKAELEALGYSPIFISAESPYYKVRFGEFEYYVDAYIYYKFMREHGSPDAFVVTIPNTDQRTSFDPPVSPLPRVFSPPETNISQAQDFVLNFNDALTSPLLPLLDKGEEEGYIPKDVAAARPLIERVVEVLPNTDPRKGWAMVRLGAMELQAERYDSARSYFLPVVNGEVKARKLDRIKAMRRVAWAYHMQGDRLTAYRAYRELERFTASDLVRAIAQVECAGLLMELARSDKGTLEECRRECQKVLATAPERFHQQRATAELMFFETYFFEEDYNRCIELGEAFLKKYPDCKREYSGALGMLAQAYGYLNKHDDSIRLLLELVNMQLGPQDRFYHFDLQKWAVGWLVWNYEAKGDKQNADYWRQRLEPNWRR